MYDDYAALYYLLLNKWEHGQLHVSSTAPPIPHHRLSQSGVPPVININASDASQSPTGLSHNQWHHMATEDLSGSETWNEYPNDPNLLRYLKLGRRHTLGAAHNHTLMAPSDLGHLREASECSSQTSNEISADTAMATPSFEPRSLQSALSSGPAEAQHLQSGSSPSSRLALLQPQVRPRTGRRASDGGPYAAVFRLYLEKRNPHLAQINSRGSLHEATTLSSSSVKHLLQDKKAQEVQCGKPAQSKEWLHYKDQVHKMFVYTCTCKFTSTCMFV